jgi:hypothetical protein
MTQLIWLCPVWHVFIVILSGLMFFIFLLSVYESLNARLTKLQIVEKMSSEEKARLKEDIAYLVPKDPRELLGDRLDEVFYDEEDLEHQRELGDIVEEEEEQHRDVVVTHADVSDQEEDNRPYDDRCQGY